MKKICLLVTILCVLLHMPAISVAQDNEAEASLLWRISGKDITRPSYLFGTIHIICRDDYFWTANMEEALGNCDKVVFELDKSDTTMKKRLMAAMVAKDGKKLSDHFAAGDYNIVRQYFKDSIGVDIDKLEKMNPIMLWPFLLKKAAGCKDIMSYEGEIYNSAKKSNKKVGGLETIEQQTELLSSRSDKMIDGLVKLAKGDANYTRGYSMLVQLYKKQNIPDFSKLTKTAGLDISGQDELLGKRNREWVIVMPEMMQKQAVFFAVGAAHLVGEQGVITLLRKAGYTVAPVK